MEKIDDICKADDFKNPETRLGATYAGDGVYIRLWAPKATRAEIRWRGDKLSHPLTPELHGYFTAFFPEKKAGQQYHYIIDGKKIADPAGRYMPNGIKGDSAVHARDFDWTDHDWQPPPFENWIIYEIHTGTYSPTHDFDGIIKDLPRLKDLGITTIELMPVAQFAGARNWGYDGVFPHAVQDSYGGPDGLKRLVDACHAHGLAIILDVVYNHLGPEGNILTACGPYTHKKYKTPWGDAINFDGADSDHVRRYFLQAAWDFMTEFHLDGFRLDAVHMIMDSSPLPFLEELSRLRRQAEQESGRKIALIAESDRNDPRLLMPLSHYGPELDAHWADDFHHTVHALLTGQTDGYYADYGSLAQLAGVYKNGVAFEGDYSSFRHKRHGRPYNGIEKYKLVTELQNHDQAGNRMDGARLSVLVDFERQKLAAGCLLLSPFTPLLFMGEEYGSTKPFLYFTSPYSKKLLASIEDARQQEWKNFNWEGRPPSPADPDTFNRCVLDDKDIAHGSRQEIIRDYYKTLIQLSPRLRRMTLSSQHDDELQHIYLHYTMDADEIFVLLSFSDRETAEPPHLAAGWNLMIDSSVFPQDAETAKTGRVAPFSARVYGKGKI